MSAARSAALIGATGAVGRALLRQLLASPEWTELRVFARRAADTQDPKLRWITVDFDQLESQLQLAGVDVLFICLGTTMKTAGSREAFRRVDHDYVLAAGRAAAAAGVGHIAAVSAVGADAGSPVFYNRVKGETEDALAALEVPALDIVRPSLLLGPRPEHRPGEALGKAVAPLLSPLLCGPLRRYRPVHVDEVAAAMIRLAGDTRAGRRVHHLPLPD